MMINQLIAIIPPGWIVQVFYDASIPGAVEIISGVGLQRQINYGRVILAELPNSMHGVKRKDILKSTWLWESMLAETVLLFFSINTVLCANSPFNLTHFSKFDYIGTPWIKGAGGSNELTMRNRSTVLEVLNILAKERKVLEGREDSSLVNILLKHSGAKVANKTVN